MSDTLEDSDHTSVQCRLKERSESVLSSAKLLGRALKPVAGLDAVALLGMTEASYIDLVQWTGEQSHPMKRGKLNNRKEPASDHPPEILWSLAKEPLNKSARSAFQSEKPQIVWCDDRPK